MGFIDYSRIGAPSYGKEIRGLGDDLFQAVRARAEDEAKAKMMAEQNRHNQETEAYNKSLAWIQYGDQQMREEREKRKEKNENLDRSITGLTKVQDALARDDGSAAPLIAAYNFGHKTLNPYGAPPQRPTAPVDPGSQPKWPDMTGVPATLEEAVQQARTAPSESKPGELTSDDLERQRTEQRVSQATAAWNAKQAENATYEKELAAYREKQKGYQGELGTFRQREEAFPKEQRNYDEHTVHEVTLANGQTVKLDVAQARYAARSKNAADLRDAVMPQLTTEMARAKSLGGEYGAKAEAEVTRKINLFNEHVASVFAGAAKPEAAYKAFQSDVREGAKEARIMSEGQLNRESAERRTHEMATRPQVSLGVQNQKLGLATEEAGRREFHRYLGTQGYKADAATMKTLVMAADSLLSGNSALDITAGAQFAKSAQGAGVLTDKDYDRFWGAIGGKETQLNPREFFERVVEGKMGEEKRQIVMAAIARKVEQEKSRYNELATRADKMFSSEPWYPGARATYFDIGQANLPPMGQAVGPRIGSSKAPGQKGGGGNVSLGGSAVPTTESGDPDMAAIRSFLQEP